MSIPTLYATSIHHAMWYLEPLIGEIKPIHTPNNLHLIGSNDTHDITSYQASCACGYCESIHVMNVEEIHASLRIIVCKNCYRNVPQTERIPIPDHPIRELAWMDIDQMTSFTLWCSDGELECWLDDIQADLEEAETQTEFNDIALRGITEMAEYINIITDYVFTDEQLKEIANELICSHIPD